MQLSLLISTMKSKSLPYRSPWKQFAALTHFLCNTHHLCPTNFTFRNPWLENKTDWVWLLENTARTQREFCSGLRGDTISAVFSSRETLGGNFRRRSSTGTNHSVPKFPKRIFCPYFDPGGNFLTSTKLIPLPLLSFFWGGKQLANKILLVLLLYCHR